MEKTIRKAEARGLTRLSWLTSYHSFSFGSYRNMNLLNFGALRVLNDDCVAPGKGFGLHPHNDMEIISIPLEGALEHQDSYGHSGVIKPGDVQVMTAGTGLLHSEFNSSDKETVCFLQIWIIPEAQGLTPSYTQKNFPKEERKNAFQLIASPENTNSLKISQQAYLSLAEFDAGKTFSYKLKSENNGLYVFVMDGKLKVEGDVVNRRDAIELCQTLEAKGEALEDSLFLAVEVPMDI